MQALIILLTLAIQDCSYYLCFIFLYIFSSSDLVSKDKTFNTRQEKEPLVVDPLGLFKVLPHSPAKKVVCSIIIVIITWLFFFLHFEYFWYHLCPQDTSSQTQATQQQWPEPPHLPQRCPPSYTTRIKFCHKHFMSPNLYVHSKVCAERHTQNHNYNHKQKVAPYVAPIGTWGDFVDSGGGSCATETDTCDARFLSTHSYHRALTCRPWWSFI